MPEIGSTVVVPTLGRPDFLLATLSDLLAQEHRPLEILVVDQSDETADEVRKLAADERHLVSYHRVTFRGLPRARNFGWRRARHEAIVFVDDDIRCDSDLVSQHVRALSAPRTDLVAGGVEEADRSPAAARPPTFDRWTAMPRGGFAGSGEGLAEHALGANFSAWRSALAAVDGFDERMGSGAALYEELDLCLRLRRAGFNLVFNGAARVRHLRASAGGCRVGEPADYLRGLAYNRAIIIRRHLPRFRRPLALTRLLATGISFAVRRRQLRLLGACISGCRSGLEAA